MTHARSLTDFLRADSGELKSAMVAMLKAQSVHIFLSDWIVGNGGWLIEDWNLINRDINEQRSKLIDLSHSSLQYVVCCIQTLQWMD